MRQTKIYKNTAIDEDQFESHKVVPALYLVPTPIGNLQDITYRAMNVLQTADIIACEDTRHSGQFLKRIGIVPRSLISYHDNNEREKSDQLIVELLSGKSVAIITDAGTPGISDPAFIVVQKAIENNIVVHPLPGATALIPAVIASGLPNDKFSFFGFLPQKKGRSKLISKIADSELTVILYESPFRIKKLIEELFVVLDAQRKVCVAKEISKIHENFFRGNISEIKEKFEKLSQIKGEFVVVVEGKGS